MTRTPQPFSLGMQFRLEEPLDYEEAREAARELARQRAEARSMLESAFAELAEAEGVYRRARRSVRAEAPRVKRGEVTSKEQDDWVDAETSEQRTARDLAKFKTDVIKERLEEIDATRASFHRLVEWSARIDPAAVEDRDPSGSGATIERLEQKPTERTRSMSGIDVTLTGEQLTFAEDVGERRNRWAAENNLRPKWGQRAEDAPEHRMNGTAGEFAFAIVLDRPDEWPETSPDEPPAATDFAGCEVRTRLRDWYELTIHPESPDDVPHVLITGLRPVFVVQGWVYGREGKLPGYWQEYVPGRPCFLSRIRPCGRCRIADRNTAARIAGGRFPIPIIHMPGV